MMRLAALLLVPALALAGESDEKVARWTLLMGGRVVLEGAGAPIRDVSELPSGPYQLEVVDWVGVNAVPEDLERLAGLERLRELRLPGPLWNRNADGGKDLSAQTRHLAGLTTLRKLTFSDHFLDSIRFRDQGLEEIKTLTGLQELGLRQAGITGKSLAPFSALEVLDITLCPVTDEGFASVAGMSNLRRLWAGNTLITGAALAAIESLTKLEDLDLSGTEVDDEGLRRLAGLRKLRRLNLQGTRVTDAAAEILARLPLLEDLNLYRTRVSNAGLARLKTLSNLRDLDLRYSRVTEAGIDELRSAIAGLRVAFVSTSGRGPAAEIPEIRTEAELRDWIHALGGKVWIDNGAVVDVSLRAASITDAAVALLTRLKQLRRLDLEGTEVGDEAAAHLAQLHSLEELILNGTAFTDAGIARLASLRALKRFHAANTYVEGEGFAEWTAPIEDLTLLGAPVNDRGLRAITRLKSLRRLHLAESDLTDDGVSALAELPNLQQFDCSACDVGDAALPAIGRLAALRFLRLRDTRITDAGLKHLAELKDLESLDLGRTRIGNDGIRHLGALKQLRLLALDYSDLDDAGFLYLSNLTRLETLDLDSTHVTDKSIPQLRSYKALKSLNLYHTLVTPEGVEQFRASAPGCKLIWDPESSRNNRRRA